MENEIKVGEYVRLDDGIVGKYQINKNWINVVETNDKYIGFDIEKDIVKHSPNLIDLIECGDYVNGYKVISVLDGFANGTMEIELSNHTRIYRHHIEDIEEVVTKEMMESISYKVTKM